MKNKANNGTTIDTHDMLLIHRLVRREIGQLGSLIRSAAGNHERAKVLQVHALEMLDFLHTHHAGEDELLWPVLRPRVSLETELLDRMESQHQQVASAVADIQRDLKEWGDTADAAIGERIADRLDGMNVTLLEHLAEEEQRILPLVAAHFTPDEWAALGKHGFGAIAGKRRLVILGHILEEADETEEREFLRQVPPPARLAFKLFGRRQHAREVTAIRG